MPSDAAIDSAMAVAGMDRYTLVSGPDGSVYLDMPAGGKLNFNAIAQGYSCDAVASVLQQWGSENYMISISEIIFSKVKFSIK